MTDKHNGIYTFSNDEIATLDHPHLLEAVAFLGPDGKPKGEPKFGANFNFKPGVDLTRMKAAMVAAARSKWPTRDIGAEVKAGTFHFPLQSGDRAADKRKNKKGTDDAAYLRGQMVLTARSQYPAKLGYVDPKNSLFEYVTDIERAQNKGKFYAGTDCLGEVEFVPYNGGTGPDGVTAYLKMVVSFNRGDRLATGGKTISQSFKGYAGKSTAEDPTQGAQEWERAGTMADADIPF